MLPSGAPSSASRPPQPHTPKKRHVGRGAGAQQQLQCCAQARRRGRRKQEGAEADGDGWAGQLPVPSCGMVRLQQLETHQGAHCEQPHQRGGGKLGALEGGRAENLRNKGSYMDQQQACRVHIVHFGVLLPPGTTSGIEKRLVALFTCVVAILAAASALC